jgi:multisite-specific tRNA:(cytosine-C5)-methyltransferase
MLLGVRLPKTGLSSHRERKREAEYPEETPETKKPRLTDDHVILETVDISAEAAETQNMEMEPKTEEDRSAQEYSSSTSKKGEKGNKGKAAGGGGSFKEQPYTFLAPEDPVLLNCM